MTQKQKKVFDFIKSFLKDNGYSPSQMEIAGALGVTQGTVRQHIKQLKDRGFIASKPGFIRSLEIV
mgnify:CR=1 FL=1